MSTPKKQEKNVQNKQTKLNDVKRKYDTQWNAVNTWVEKIRALGIQKENLTREVAALKFRHQISLGTFRRHEQRLAESGRPGANGEFEKNARKDLENEEKKYKKVEDEVKAVTKGIETAQESERKARRKLDELHGKLADARIKLRIEEGRLLQFGDRYRLAR
ncbi:hypothetical protein F5X98DRAFT_382388 [Xylaria grammica]|nr:hypothetical protein F5X98DRAFT_382388 [Xylaria grammica]